MKNGGCANPEDRQFCGTKEPNKINYTDSGRFHRKQEEISTETASDAQALDTNGGRGAQQRALGAGRGGPGRAGRCGAAALRPPVACGTILAVGTFPCVSAHFSLVSQLPRGPGGRGWAQSAAGRKWAGLAVRGKLGRGAGSR